MHTQKTQQHVDSALDTKTLKELEDLLLDLKAELEGQIHNDFEEDTGKRAMHAYFDEDEETEPVAEDLDENDFNRGEIEDQIELINEALQRIKEGDYGVCVECGGVIDLKTLRSMPEAARCTKCASHSL